jgi:hypothetical protein
MKIIAIILLILLGGNILSAQKSIQDKNKQGTGAVTDATGKNDPQQDQSRRNEGVSETKITPGASGVKRSIGYKFSSLVSGSDPGDGYFRLSNVTISAANILIVDKVDVSGEDQSKWFSTWENNTGATGRGQITMVEINGRNTLKFNVSGVSVNKSGFWQFPVTYVSGKPPREGEIYYYVFERIDHKKDQEVKSPEPDQKPVSPDLAHIIQPELKPTEETNLPVVDQKPGEKPLPPVADQKPAEAQQPPVVDQKPEEKIIPPVVDQKPAEEPEQPVVEQEPLKEPVPPVITPHPSDPTVRTTEARRVSETVHRRQVSEPVAERKATVPEQRATQTAKTGDQPSQANETAKTINQPVHQTGPTWTSTVTHGAQPSQGELPAAGTGNNLPVYQYRYSTGRMSRGKWYAGIIEAGYGLGTGDYGMDNFRFNFINGFRIGETFSIGLGLGLRRYYPEHADFEGYSLVSGKYQVPVFLDIRKIFSTRKVTPYLAFGIGGSSSFRTVADSVQTVKEGLLFNPSGGIWFNISSRFALFCGVAYEMQKLEFILNSDDSRFKKNAGSVSLNLGIAF